MSRLDRPEHAEDSRSMSRKAGTYRGETEWNFVATWLLTEAVTRPLSRRDPRHAVPSRVHEANDDSGRGRGVWTL